MAMLQLVKTDTGDLLLQGAGDPSTNADFSLYSLDGDGGDPFAYGNQSWEVVREVEGEAYDPADTDTFWMAVEAVTERLKQVTP